MSKLKESLKNWLYNPISVDSSKNLFNLVKEACKKNKPQAVIQPPINSITTVPTPINGGYISGACNISQKTPSSIAGSGQINWSSLPITGTTTGMSMSGTFVTGIVMDTSIQIAKLVNDKYVEIHDIDEIEINEEYYYYCWFAAGYTKFYVADMDIFKKDYCGIEVFISPNDEKRLIKFDYKTKKFILT